MESEGSTEVGSMDEENKSEAAIKRRNFLLHQPGNSVS